MTGRRSLQIHKKAVVDVDMVAKLVRLIGSDQSGEQLAAIAVLKRTLDIAGLNLSDLGDVVIAGFKKPEKQRTPARWAPSAPDLDYWESMCWYSHFYRDRLSDRDRGYVHDVLMGRHFGCGRADAAMMSRLRSIVAKVGAARSAEDIW
jgi:hypothetical protein